MRALRRHSAQGPFLLPQVPADEVPLMAAPTRPCRVCGGDGYVADLDEVKRNQKKAAAL